ncbi:MAG: SufB/SufD family protein [Candidatus Woesearchaeota archaeon]
MIRKHSLGVSTDLEWVKKDAVVEDSKVEISGNASFEETNDFLEVDQKEVFDELHEKSVKRKKLVLDTGSFELNNTSNNSFNEFIIEVKENSNVKLLVNTESDGFSTDFLKVILKEGSSLDITHVKDSKHYLHSRSHFFLGNNSTVNIVSADFSGTIFNDVKVFLDGRGCKSTLNHLFYGVKEDNFDVKLSSVHGNKDVYSLINAKGILDGGRIVTRGLVKINSNSPDSNGYQKTDILQLSPSRAVSIPDLLIHNEQVKCSHGSTITSLEDDKIFYLQSRGLKRKDAEKSLVIGFVQNLIDESFISDKLLERVLSKLK